MAKTISLNASPAWPGVKDDFLLHYEGHNIGRIRRLGVTWDRSITIPMAMPAWAQGRRGRKEVLTVSTIARRPLLRHGERL
ncbi:MAG: hypothetical protein K2X57_13390 [Xanthobacteraceae bacterium]|nr:hypothetical protein [Xanthobacteraceae bacterium]